MKHARLHVVSFEELLAPSKRAAVLKGMVAFTLDSNAAGMGVRPDDLDQSVAVVADALVRTLDSEMGRWLLSGDHEEEACELPISGVIDGRLVNAVVDRTFVDADGVRWVVDYKSGYHAGSDLEGFLAQEREHYQEQLDGYRRLFEQLEYRPVKTALYLPRHGRLEVVAPADSG